MSETIEIIREPNIHKPVVEEDSILADIDSFDSVQIMDMDSTQVPDTTQMSKQDSLGNHTIRTKYWWNIVSEKAIFPTEYSISGIGVLFLYKNIAGKIFIGMSLLISLFFLFLWRFLRRKKLNYKFICLNIFSILAFIIVSFISKVDLLYGVWILLILLVIQYFLEYIDGKKEVQT